MKDIICNKKNWILLTIFTLASICFISLFSFTTSPFWYNYGCDSEIFRMLGRLTYRGFVPYVDFFDHKGPFIITVEWLGCLISEDRIGIFIVQIAFLTVTLCATYKLLRLSFSVKVSAIIAVLMLLVLRLYYEGGNLTEEYCLPFIIWSCYLASKYMIKGVGDVEDHPFTYSLFYGITFVVCAFTRLTNAFPICCILLVGVVTLAIKKKWANIIKNGISFVLGVTLAAMPYIVFFIANDGLYEMLYATFIYNFKHGSDYSELVLFDEKVKLLMYAFVLVGTLMMGIYTIAKKQKMQIMGWCIVAMSICGMMFHFKMRFYCHYYMIYIPIILMTLLCVKEYILEKEERRGLSLFKGIVMVVLIICLGFYGVKNLTSLKDFEIISSKQKNYENMAEQMKKIVSEIEKDSAIFAYNVEPYFYIETDVTPCYRNFIIQDMQTEYDDELREGFENDLYSLEADYIVVKVGADNRYSEFIDKNYVVEKESKDYILYKKSNYYD